MISEDNVIRTEKTHTSRKAAMADLKTIVGKTPNIFRFLPACGKYAD